MQKLLALQIGNNYTKIMPDDINTSVIPRNNNGVLNISLNDITNNNSTLKLCGNDTWKTGHFYYAHPKRKGFFISSEKFERYIIEEQFKDIADYVSEYMDIAYLQFSLVNRKKKDVGINAVFDLFSLGANGSSESSREYSWKIKGVKKSNVKKPHYWIDDFPMIKLFAEKNSDEYENIEQFNEIYQAGTKVIALGYGGGNLSFNSGYTTKYYVKIVREKN